MSQDPIQSAESTSAGELAHAPAPQKVANIDLGTLERIRRWSKYAAVVVTVLFVVLLIAVTIKLERMIGQISTNQVLIDNQTKKIDENSQRIQAQDKEIAGKTITIKALVNRDQGLNPEQAAEVRQNVENVVQSGGEKQIAARIYVQIGDEDQRKRASEAVNLLQKKGYIVPGIENVGGKAKTPSISQLRYYPTDSLSEQDIKDIASALDELGIRLKPTPLSRGGGRPRHYEIWFGQDF
jgi:hypothetical protein